MSDPKIPAFPGFLRFCTPVRDAADPERVGVVVGTWPNNDVVRVHWTWNDDTEDVPVARLLADMGDATGRAHAAWWLAERVGLAPSRVRLHMHRAHGLAVVQATDDVSPPSGAPERWDLSDLDPADPRLLPDGSRLVDALALQRVVLHVAGVTP